MSTMSADVDAGSSKHKPLLVLGKITEILDAFSLAKPSMTLGELQQATGLPTSTVQRLVTNMATQGFLDRVGDQIRVGTRMALLGRLGHEGSRHLDDPQAGTD